MAGRGGVILPKLNDNGALTTELDERLKRMIANVERATINAAKVATTTSRQTFTSREVGRPFTSPRAHRSTTQGKFTSLIDWIPHRRGGEMVVDLDLAKLEQGTPTFYGGPGYWLIQEIGTGNEAAAYIGPSQTYERRYRVKSQKGRAIPFGLAWSGNTGNDQIVPSRLEQGAEGPVFHGNPKSQIIIGREIEGKHYLRDGGTAGFNQFYDTALVAAKQAFAGRPYRP